MVLLATAACSDATGPAGPASVEIPVTELSFTWLGETIQLQGTILDPAGRPLPYHLTGLEADTFYTWPEGRAYLRSLMQRAVDEGAFLDLFFHQIPPETVEDFRAFLADLHSFGDRVLPYHELFPPEPRTVF